MHVGTLTANKGAEDNWHTQMIAMDWTAKRYKVGNCMEQAAIAFLHLERTTAAPLDYMAFSNSITDSDDRPLYDHAWVVIGRLAGSDPRQVRTWGPAAVWCDPWQLRAGRVYSIDDLVKGKATNLDSTFNLHSERAVNDGWPGVLWRRP